jgi:hypothetical protein
MATEHNQNTKSMDSLERNASNTITNDTDRKHSSQDIKCEISTDKHQNEIQINWTTKCIHPLVKYSWMPLDSIEDRQEMRNKVVRLQAEERQKKYGSIKVVRKTDEVWRLRKTDDE